MSSKINWSDEYVIKLESCRKGKKDASLRLKLGSFLTCILQLKWCLRAAAAQREAFFLCFFPFLSWLSGAAKNPRPPKLHLRVPPAAPEPSVTRVQLQIGPPTHHRLQPDNTEEGNKQDNDTFPPQLNAFYFYSHHTLPIDFIFVWVFFPTAEQQTKQNKTMVDWQLPRCSRLWISGCNALQKGEGAHCSNMGQTESCGRWYRLRSSS